jgi:hypothetical protein
MLARIYNPCFASVLLIWHGLQIPASEALVANPLMLARIYNPCFASFLFVWHGLQIRASEAMSSEL